MKNLSKEQIKKQMKRYLKLYESILNFKDGNALIPGYDTRIRNKIKVVHFRY
jgi:hypothetical protein